MFVHPSIAKLRSNRAPQQHAQSAIEAARLAWRDEPGARELLAEIEAFGAGAPISEGGALERIFTAAGEGERLLLALSRIMCACLAENPLAHPPFRNGSDGRTASMLLARSGRAQLLIQSREPGDYARGSYSFSDVLRYDAVLGGAAKARLVRLNDDRREQAKFAQEDLQLRSGSRLSLDLMSETLEVDSVSERLIVLRLLRFADNPAPTREYSREDGFLLQQCAGSLATSRQEAIVALLGRMGREDAAPQLARIALGDGDMSLRWQALRESLALDTACGFAALCELARNHEDPLAADAGALRAQLIETYPQLASLKDAPCPV